MFLKGENYLECTTNSLKLAKEAPIHINFLQIGCLFYLDKWGQFPCFFFFFLYFRQVLSKQYSTRETFLSTAQPTWLSEPSRELAAAACSVTPLPWRPPGSWRQGLPFHRAFAAVVSEAVGESRGCTERKWKNFRIYDLWLPSCLKQKGRLNSCSCLSIKDSCRIGLKAEHLEESPSRFLRSCTWKAM